MNDFNLHEYYQKIERIINLFGKKTLGRRKYSVITNFGCHWRCPYCITKTRKLNIPETDMADVSETIALLIEYGLIDFLSFSGGGDPLFAAKGVSLQERAEWYSRIVGACEFFNIETEMHTSFLNASVYAITQNARFDRWVFHLNSYDQLDRVPRLRHSDVRVVFVVTPDMTEKDIDRIADYIHNDDYNYEEDPGNINQLSFRQLINPDGSIDHTLQDYLEQGDKQGRWYYIQQGDYNRYIVNDMIYDTFQEIGAD